MSRCWEISRREFVKWGGAAAVSGAAWHGTIAAAPLDAIGVLDAVMLDTRFQDFPAVADPRVPVLRFSGDVTDVWYDHLDLRWRRSGFVLGGITGADALFVLETLASHQGRRVVSRIPLDLPLANGVKAVRWIIAPHHPSVSS